MPETGSRKKKLLSVHMLGDFWMALDGERLELPGGIFSKTMNLLLLILLYGDRGIPRKRVQGLFYGEGEADHGAGSLRVVAHRLKKQMVAAGLMEEGDSLGERGLFLWKPKNIQIQVDARMFEEAARSALKEGEIREDLFAQACRLYTGELLPELISEIWVAENQAYLQELYFECTHRYLAILNEEKEFDQMLSVVRDAIRLYPYEEWFIAELDALIGLGRWEEAMEVSETSVGFLMDKIGIQPSAEMEARIRTIRGRLMGSSRELKEIQGELEEKESRIGGLCCNYFTFVWAYRYEMRQLERSESCHCLLLCSLTEKDGTLIREDGKGLEKAMDELGSVLASSLRRSDIYTRYGRNQYLALIVNLNREECSSICARVEKNLLRKGPNVGKYRIRYFHVPVTANAERLRWRRLKTKDGE